MRLSNSVMYIVDISELFKRYTELVIAMASEALNGFDKLTELAIYIHDIDFSEQPMPKELEILFDVEYQHRVGLLLSVITDYSNILKRRLLSMTTDDEFRSVYVSNATYTYTRPPSGGLYVAAYIVVGKMPQAKLIGHINHESENNPPISG